MKNKIKEVLLGNRFKSLYWRTGMMILAIIVSSLLSSLELLTSILSPGVVVFSGLILGEISKVINNSLSEGELIK